MQKLALVVAYIIVLVSLSVPVFAQSFIEAQLTVADDGTLIPNLVARPAVNISGRWNLQGLAWVGEEWAEMYVGPMYMFVQPSDSLDIIQISLLAGVGLEQADKPLRFGSLFEAVGLNWDGLVAVEYGDSGLYYKSQFSHAVFGSDTSFVGLGLCGESSVGVGPRLTWTKFRKNEKKEDQVIQTWLNAVYDPRPERFSGSFGVTYLW